MPDRGNDASCALCNQAAREGLKAMGRILIDAGASPEEWMVSAESLVVGLFLMRVKVGGDAPVIEVFADRLRERVAEERFRNVKPGGQA
jgi:hypothetical protein